MGLFLFIRLRETLMATYTRHTLRDTLTGFLENLMSGYGYHEPDMQERNILQRAVDDVICDNRICQFINDKARADSYLEELLEVATTVAWGVVDGYLNQGDLIGTGRLVTVKYSDMPEEMRVSINAILGIGTYQGNLFFVSRSDPSTGHTGHIELLPVSATSAVSGGAKLAMLALCNLGITKLTAARMRDCIRAMNTPLQLHPTNAESHGYTPPVDAPSMSDTMEYGFSDTQIAGFRELLKVYPNLATSQRTVTNSVCNAMSQIVARMVGTTSDKIKVEVKHHPAVSGLEVTPYLIIRQLDQDEVCIAMCRVTACDELHEFWCNVEPVDISRDQIDFGFTEAERSDLQVTFKQISEDMSVAQLRAGNYAYPDGSVTVSLAKALGVNRKYVSISIGCTADPIAIRHQLPVTITVSLLNNVGVIIKRCLLTPCEELWAKWLKEDHFI
jgi:hypothetical protein